MVEVVLVEVHQRVLVVLPASPTPTEMLVALVLVAVVHQDLEVVDLVPEVVAVDQMVRVVAMEVLAFSSINI